jgi:phytoene dehydrogenase-like protein
MGALTAKLERVARAAGAEIVTEATVTHIGAGPSDAEIAFRHDDTDYHVSATYTLANIAPTLLSRLMDDPTIAPEPVEGSVFKINLLLKRLPRLRADGYDPSQAFAGTFHIDEGYDAMNASYDAAQHGQIPDNPPGEIYCHTLTDPSILSPALQTAGYHTLTLFGLDCPYRLFTADPIGTKQEITSRYLRAINRYLAEPIEDCLALDQDGNLCIDAKSPVDLQDTLGLPCGNIFHNDLAWPFAEHHDEIGTWGVETAYPNVFLCGSGARRGGGVSGIPGHNAAMKVLGLVSTAPSR